ncbi:arginine deiminase [Halobacillus yeomjeoni]|uniref:arginine deiminase family protein n=1 Tax=Halobacillus yeomjeoni TaxID=311194 RepID=UPI001CD44B40|nr:arginine deiminase family protein [Halobacillus yeomjeoni]MCA0984591.1 arginine deiminase [Halobacillus yeomjeoni]
MDITPSCFSEHEELKKVLVCSPTHLDIPNQQTADMVQWIEPVQAEKALDCHKKMVQSLESAGVKVIDYNSYIPGNQMALHQQLINRHYVRDLACVFGNTLLPGEPGTSMRKPEYTIAHQLFQKWFTSSVFPIDVKKTWLALEYGDVFVLNSDAVLINTGLRTSMESIENAIESIFEAGFSEIGVIDLPRQAQTLHLDMNANIVGGDLFVAKSYIRYLPIQILSDKSSCFSMSHEFIERHGFEVVWLDEIKHTLADLNFLNINPDTLLISSQAEQKLFQYHDKWKKKEKIKVDVSELEKGGGGIRCMTLPLERG